MTYLIRQLDEAVVMNDETLELDATFIEAYSQRGPKDNCRGLSHVNVPRISFLRIIARAAGYFDRMPYICSEAII